MRLRVHCEEWVLGDRGYGVAVGDSFSEWLVLDDDEGRTAELRATYEALVTPLKPWEGLALGYHAYRLDIGPVPVYCEWAEEMDPGPGVVTGVLSVDTYVARLTGRGRRGSWSGCGPSTAGTSRTPLGTGRGCSSPRADGTRRSSSVS